MKLNQESFLTCFIAARLGQLSKSLDLDPTVIEKAVEEAKRASERYWGYVNGIDIKTNSDSAKKQITLDQWKVLEAAKDLEELLTDFHKGFVKGRIKAGRKQDLTPKQAGIISSIQKNIKAL